MTEAKIRGVFLGTPDVAAKALAAILRKQEEFNFEIVAVITQPPRPVGRSKKLTPSPVHHLAESCGLPVYTPEKSSEPKFLDILKGIAPDICLTAAFGQLLPQAFLDIPRYGTLNIHPSLLPRWRGAAPVQRTLEAGDSETGVTLAQTVLALDAGPIVAQKTSAVAPLETTPEMLQRLFLEGVDVFLKSLKPYINKDLKPISQDESKLTYAKKLERSESLIDPHALTAQQVLNKFRGFTPWPGCTIACNIGGSSAVLKLHRLSPRGENMGKVGLIQDKNALYLVCRDAKAISLDRIQAPGKRPLEAAEFLNGLQGSQIELLNPHVKKEEPNGNF